MKRKLFKQLAFIPLGIGFGLSVNAQYCGGGPSQTFDTHIQSIQMSGIQGTALNIASNCPAQTGVQNETAQSVSVIVGQTYTMSILRGFCSGNVYGHVGQIWIDFNEDFTYQASESVGTWTGLFGDNTTTNVTITIPEGVDTGTKRMRVSMQEGGAIPLNPCAAFSYGNIIEFSVLVLPLPDAPPVPEQALGTPSCDLGTILDVTGTPDTGIEWYWQESASGTSTDIPYNGPYTVYSNGTYYLRAYNPLYDLWSDASSVVVSNFPIIADLPPIPVAGTNPVCIVGTEITMPTPDPGFEYYWQTIENGTSSVNNSSTPWDITTTGTYYVATFEPASNCWSETTSISVVVDTYVPEAPTVTESVFNLCIGETTQEIEAEAPSSGTLSIILGENVNWAVGTTILSGNINLPNGATITGSTFIINGVSTFDGTWLSDLSFNLSGVATFPTTYLPGGGATNAGPFTYPLTVSESGSITLTLVNNWFTDATAQSFILEVSYDIPVSTIAWYDAALGGSEIGTGSPFQTVGTSIMNTPAETGIYQFFAGSVSGACISEDRALVTINVNAVNVELTAIDVSCNGGNNGSFAVSNIYCGVEPFSYSVDGGSFGTIPTNLTVGTHSVVVMDDNDEESAEYTISIGEPFGVENITASAVSASEIELSWTTTGTETEWVVEYGESGFISGSGTTVNVNQNPVIIGGLDELTTYDFYVSSLCAVGFEGDQNGPATATTFCSPILAQGFCENFASDSETQDCWTVIDANGDGDAWDMNYAFNPYSGNQVAILYTDFNNGNNDDWLITPQLTLTGNEVFSFFYRVQSAFEPNDFRVMLSTTGTNPADFTETLMDLASYDNIVYQDTAINLSAYTGNVFIAFHVPPSGLDGWRLYIDQVCIDICTPNASQGGAQDVCRLDGNIDLNTIIVPGENNGTWSFTANPGLLSGSNLNVSALPGGSYQAMYVVTTACPEEADTVYASINVYGPSTAGNNGTVQSCNYGPLNLFDGLTGTVDLGGTWYDPAGNPLPNAIVNFNGQIAANYNYYYITSNNVCPADTAFVEVQLQNCASIAENELLGFALYPNPTSDVINIQYSGVAITANLVLVDTKGSVIYNEKVNLASDDSIEMDLSTLEKGVYFLNIYGEEGSKVIKVVRN